MVAGESAAKGVGNVSLYVGALGVGKFGRRKGVVAHVLVPRRKAQKRLVLGGVGPAYGVKVGRLRIRLALSALYGRGVGFKPLLVLLYRGRAFKVLPFAFKAGKVLCHRASLRGVLSVVRFVSGVKAQGAEEEAVYG